MYNKSTYTAGRLKEAVFKTLGISTFNGKDVGYASGALADIEDKYVAAANICLRRIALSLPLIIKTAELTFENGSAELPKDCAKAVSLKIGGQSVPNGAFFASDGRIFLTDGIRTTESECRGEMIYSVSPEPLSEDTEESCAIALPDITADALVYLIASELCPAENGELYSKLMYKYRDIALNCYNAVSDVKRRNSFWKSSKRRRF